ncbi:MAG: hypothetical protein Q9200_004740 [Gallowayella weberi]
MDDDQASQGLGDPKLLEIIDKLMELNIQDSVALPQLLVVEDQSSGKSSVLEGVTGLPFPRDSTLCTRFATQITFRRTPDTKFSLSIIPSKDTSKEDAARMKDWKVEGIESLNRKDFSRILHEVHGVMGIGGSDSGAKKSFSDDFLKIEVAGPDQQHLSVVDVPGIFRKITEGVTTQSDIVNVRAMVERYMANPRSIILAVVPANVDIATQEILNMAKAQDPDEQRTLGVLTKPDLVDEGAEDNILNLLQGTTHTLSLGWYMVKNPGQQDLKRGDDFDRHAAEKAFFKNHAIWSKVEKDKVDVDSLRFRLVELLTAIVRKEFSHVRMDVIQQLKKHERTLKALGPSRGRVQEQQRYLLELADRYHQTTVQAIEAHYGSDDVFDSDSLLRLATVVVGRNEIFSSDMQRKGHNMKFKDDDTEQSATTSSNSSEVDLHDTAATRYHIQHNDIDDLVYDECIPASPEDGITNWIAKVYKSSRGFEIGTFDPSLIPIMWKQQSSKWNGLALGYTSDVISIAHYYIRTMLSEISQDDRVAGGLLSVMMEKLTEQYKRAIDQKQFILEVERNTMTYNHYSADNLEKCNRQCMKKMLEKKSFEFERITHHGAGSSDLVVRLSDLDEIPSMSNLDNIVQHLQDILNSYYKGARKRFVDNVCMQAVDRHLIQGPDAAVKVLTPAFISDLTEEQLERIAGEDLSKKRKRTDLTRQVENLTKARDLLVAV